MLVWGRQLALLGRKVSIVGQRAAACISWNRNRGDGGGQGVGCIPYANIGCGEKRYDRSVWGSLLY